MTNIIQVQGLCKHFQTLVKHDGFAGSMRSLFHPERESVKAVQDITFEIEQGERLAFIGPNGAGKSTTIKMLVGILYPTAGSAQVLSYTPWKQRQQLAYHIGTVFGQKSQISYHLPAQDSFDLLAHIYGLEKPDYGRRLAYLKELFDIEEFLTTPVRKLSLGQRMRCEITAALLHKPKILFLDEPTIGLDVVVKQRIRDLILELNQQEQVTVFLTSHDAGDVEVLCRRAMVINHGEVIYDGQVNDLKHNYLRTKTVSLKLGQDWKGFDAQGVTLLKHRDYGVKLEVNTEVTSIDRVIAQLLAQYSIVDINVDNPPMEQVIAQIYGQDHEAAR